jgi:hypothetical protein
MERSLDRRSRKWEDNIKVYVQNGGSVWIVSIWLRIGTTEGLV